MSKWQHYVVFSSISIVLIFVQNLIGQNANPGDRMMMIMNVTVIIQIPLTMIVMIRTYKNKEQLSFRHKFFFLLGIITVVLISGVIINFINPFGRNISLDDFKVGVLRTSVFSIIIMILCLPLIKFLKSRMLTGDV